MFSFRPYAISAGALIAVAASVNSSYAQQSDNGLTLEEVVVTAQKKSESLQDAPISLLAFDSGVLGILPPNTAKASEAPMFTGL